MRNLAIKATVLNKWFAVSSANEDDGGPDCPCPSAKRLEQKRDVAELCVAFDLQSDRITRL